MRTYQFDKKGSEIQELLDQIKNKTIYGNATKDTAGLMSAEDKGTLDTLVDNVGENIQQLNSLNQAVSENTTAIGTNTDNIATNTSDISALKTTTGNLGTRLDAAEETLDNIFQLDANNFMGIYDAAASLPAMTGAGWALVGADLTALNAYVYNIPQAQWQQYGNTTYDYSDYSGLATQVATIGSKLGDLTSLTTTSKASAVAAINEVNRKASSIRTVTASGFSIADDEGNIMMSVNENGLDVARLSNHFMRLVAEERSTSGDEDDDIVKEYGLPMLDAARANVLEHNLDSRFLNFAFITDTHTEGTHQIFNLNAVKNMKLFRIFCNEKIVDFGIHCGDLYTDYGTSREEALKLIDSSTQILCDIDCPMFFVKGNHDNNGKGRYEADIAHLDWEHETYYIAKVSNYGLTNASFSYVSVTEDTWDGESTLYVGSVTKELNITKYQYYLLTQKLADSEVTRSSTDPYGAYYYKDYDELGIRIVALNFYDREAQDATLGYWEAGGLSTTQLTWLNNVALNTENAVIVFSHWYNAALVSALASFSSNGGELIALIHGHSHADQYDNSGGINNIGVRNGFGIATEMAADQRKSFAFSVFTVDTDSKILYETRLGNGVSRSFSYDTPSQIS